MKIGDCGKGTEGGNGQRECLLNMTAGLLSLPSKPKGE